MTLYIYVVYIYIRMIYTYDDVVKYIYMDYYVHSHIYNI